MSTTTASTLAMETLHDAGPYKHLRFRRGPAGWDLHTFPGGVMVQGSGNYTFTNGSDDIVDAVAFTGADPAYWADKSAGSTRVWSERAFRSWLVEEGGAEALEEEVEEFLDGSDLYTEAFAREALAGTKHLDIDFPDTDVGDFYVWDPAYLQALRLVSQGLAHYAQQR